MTNITVQELAGIHPKLMGLNLSHCDQVTDVGMWAIARHCLFLQKLYLDACDKVAVLHLFNASKSNFKLWLFRLQWRSSKFY